MKLSTDSKRKFLHFCPKCGVYFWEETCPTCGAREGDLEVKDPQVLWRQLGPCDRCRMLGSGMENLPKVLNCLGALPENWNGLCGWMV